MKIRVYVVDLEMSARAKRIVFGVGIPLALLLLGAGVAYAAGLVTWTSGQTLTADDLNSSFKYVQDEIVALQGTNALTNCTLQTQVVSAAVPSGTPGSYSVSAVCPSGSVATGCGFD